MLEGMDMNDLNEWVEFYKWENEMEQRAVLQAKADAGVDAMKGRKR